MALTLLPGRRRDRAANHHERRSRTTSGNLVESLSQVWILTNPGRYPWN